MYDPNNRVQFLNMGAFVEGGVILIALFLAWVLDVEWIQFLHWNGQGTIYGIVGLLPMLLLFFVLHRFPFGSLLKVKRFLIDVMGPSLAACYWFELLLLAALAGLAKSYFFAASYNPG